MTLRIIMSVLAGFFLLGGGGYAGYTYFSKPKPQTYIVCKDDVKQCKDGITVGRVSPQCEFSVCPEDRPLGSTGGINVLPVVPLSGTSTRTLEDIRGNGGDYTCMLATEEGITGVVVASQGELRGDFDPVMKPNVRAVPTHILLGKSMTYAWTGIKNSGVSFVRGSALGGEKVKDLLPFDVAGPHTFACSPWTPDRTVFLAPVDVTFANLTPAVASSTPL